MDQFNERVFKGCLPEAMTKNEPSSHNKVKRHYNKKEYTVDPNRMKTRSSSKTTDDDKKNP